MRILIVDDESLNRFLLSHMLEEAGYTDCYEAESGHEALKLAERIKPDLVLLDVVMDDMDGYEVAPKLKQLAGDIYLPIIFITALDDQASLARCLEVGGDDFASKPFDKMILTAKIRAHARTRLLSKKSFEQNQELVYYRNAVEREHSIVEHIFKNALTINQSVRQLFDYRLAPASSFNGDLFLIEPSPSGGVYFLMGDFTGHGLASAIGALPVTRAFQAMSEKGISVSEMASTINSTLLKLLPGDMFFASVIVEIGNSGTQFNIWHGGMPDMLLIATDGTIRKRFESMHMALGVLEADEFEDDVEHFEAEIGDRLVGYSDGVVELTNAQEKMLGDDALVQWITSQPDIKVHELEQKIEAFRGVAEQLDDITLVSYTCQPLDNIDSGHTLCLVPFSINIDLDANQLKQIDPIHELITMVSSQNGMQGIRSDFSTVLSELYNNALDHGLLKLDSAMKKSTDGFFEYFEARLEKLAELSEGNISIHVQFNPDSRMLFLTVEDSGQGFDIETVCHAGETDSFGRGITLIRELCHQIQYSDGGCTANVIFKM